ncbi:MAG: hypothetical protein CL758_07640 [Chloroflexi bacterium]|nr:hypothetical protein [Chloroflexota bacterium]|tara:strand:+ start:5871 stop:6572 length:702 start_codon:yes stop_codon:yes gene_type:complete
MKNVMIRQPGYMPNLGFFKKIQSSDIFVFLDDVQFSKDSFDNRNKIKTISDFDWITVPLQRPVYGKKLNQILISDSTNWIKKHSDLIYENYKSAPFFSSYWYEIKQILDRKFNSLIELNLNLINYFLKILEIPNETIKSSELKTSKTKTERLIEICKLLNASSYISGKGGKNYIDETLFQKSNIDLTYENFIHPQYSQLHGNFIENLSIIDLILNEGPNSSKILKNSKFSQEI